MMKKCLGMRRRTKKWSRSSIGQTPLTKIWDWNILLGDEVLKKYIWKKSICMKSAQLEWHNKENAFYYVLNSKPYINWYHWKAGEWKFIRKFMIRDSTICVAFGSIILQFLIFWKGFRWLGNHKIWIVKKNCNDSLDKATCQIYL